MLGAGELPALSIGRSQPPKMDDNARGCSSRHYAFVDRGHTLPGGNQHNDDYSADPIGLSSFFASPPTLAGADSSSRSGFPEANNALLKRLAIKVSFAVHLVMVFLSRGLIPSATYHLGRRPKLHGASIIDATADLLAETEVSRIRKCESCIVHFFDTSKKASRRWCSMNICGNKLKVAAYQRRKRGDNATMN